MSLNRMVYTGTAYFGENARKEILTEISKHHFRKAFIVSDHDLERCGVEKKIEDVLDSGSMEYEVFEEIKPNPTIENVLDGLKHFEASGSDFILAVGGGSVIDTGKAISVIAANPENRDVVSLEGMDKSRNWAVPLMAVPTTAGTGSETTMDYVITNTSEKRKMACMDSKAVPVAAFVDTEIMALLPMRLTAATAMDALTHAVESFLAAGASDFSEMLSLKAVRLISQNFLKVIKEPHDLEARKKIAVAQYMAGMSFTNAGLGIVHSMAHPLSAYYDIPHGIANALILPYIVEFNSEGYSGCKEKMNELAEAFDPEFDEDRCAATSAEHCAAIIRSFIKAAGLPERLSDAGAKEEDIPELARSAYNDASTPDNPRKVGEADLEKLYRKMF